MISIDTNVLLRLLLRDDEIQYVKAKQAVSNGGAWISQVVIQEAVWVMSNVYELSDEQVHGVLSMMLDHEDYAVENKLVVILALQAYKKYPKLGFSDCLVWATSYYVEHLPLKTFDKAASKLDRAELIK